MDKIEKIEFDAHVTEGIQILHDLIGEKFILVGAAARDILLAMHNIKPERATRDVDFAVRVEDWDIYNELRRRLIEKGFKENRAPHIFIFKTATFDIIPFGEITTEKSEILWPQDGRVMTMLGFEEAFNTSHRFTTSKELRIHIASLASLVMLKIIAWKDRPTERSQDPLDISTIMRRYFDAGNRDRFYDDHSELADMEPFTVERAGAALLGRDLKKICAKSTLAKIKSILEDELHDVEASLFFQQMSRAVDLDSQIELIKLMLSEC